MEATRKSTVIVILALLLAACTSTTTAQPAQTAQPGVVQIDAVRVVEEMLATQLAISVDTIKIVRVEDAEWLDTCLGMGTEVESCAKVITRGFRIVLQVEDKQYTFRTDDDGSVVKLEMIQE